MDLFSSMGVSNEIVDRAEISLEQGCLLVLESQDYDLSHKKGWALPRFSSCA